MTHVRPAALFLMLTAAALPSSAAAPKPAALAFPLADVRLLDGPFKEAMLADQKFLLELDADRLLAGFLDNAGLPAKAKKYGGWESRGLSGQTFGHYLSALSLMYAATGESVYKERLDYCVDELARCQDKSADGFLGGMPRGVEMFDEIKRGDSRPKPGFDLNGGWVPWYNQHKLFAGVRDAYLLTGSGKAKQIYVKLGDWCATVVANLDDRKMQRMLAVEQGGMMETLADLYVVTGDKKHLDTALRFWHKAVLDPLAAGEDKLTGLHANTNIPKVIASARLYEITGDEKYAKTARTFWDAVVNRRSFVTGSNSDREHFFDLGVESKKLGPQNGETCNVYNMLKLTGHLARWTGDATPYDFYERAMVNHILGSIDPATGHCTYFQSLEPGRFKIYSDTENSFWCCTGTGLENHAKYAADVYTHGDDTLNVNLFVASELSWKDKGLVLRQETAFPASDETKLSVKLDKPTKLKLRIRMPVWTEGGFQSTPMFHGQEIGGNTTFTHEDGYHVVDTTWHDGDTITVKLPMKPKLHKSVDDPTMAAVTVGPVVLAAQLGTEGMPEKDNISDHVRYDNRPIPPVPMLVTDSQTLEWLQPVPGKPLTYTTAGGVARPSAITFAPLYATHHQRYGVYMRLVDVPQYTALQKKLDAAAEAKRRLDARTVDTVAFGEQQSEVDHAAQNADSTSGVHMGRPWRDAKSGGFFNARVKLKPGEAQAVRVTYFGGDRDRTFDVLIDGQKVATQTLTGRPAGEFFDVDYTVPASLILAKKDSALLEFRPHQGSMAGGVFGCRVITAGPGKELMSK